MKIDNELVKWLSAVDAGIRAASPITALAWSRDAQMVAVGDVGGQVVIWQHLSGTYHTRLRRELGVPIVSLSWSHDDLLLAIGTGDSGVRICDVDNRGDVHAKNGDASCVAWSPIHLRLAFGGRAGKLHLVDFERGVDTADEQVGIGHAYPITSLAWSPNGDVLASGTAGGTIGLWLDSNVDNQLRHFLAKRQGLAHERSVRDLAWCSETDRLASISGLGSGRGQLCLWNVDSRSPTDIVRVDDDPLRVSFAAKGTIAIVRGFATVRLFHCSPLREIATWPSVGALEPFPSSMSATADRVLIADSTNATTKLWRVDYPRLLKASQITSRSFRVAGVSVFGEPDTGRSSIAKQLAGERASIKREAHGFRVHPVALPAVETDRTSESRYVSFWDLPSIATENSCDFPLVQRMHAGEPLVTVVVLDALTQLRGRAPGWDALTVRPIVPTGNHSVVFALTRCDRLAEWPVSELDDVARALGVERVYATSARTGQGIPELQQAVLDAIPWERAGKMDSLDTFMAIQGFLELQRERGKTLVRFKDLYDEFLTVHPEHSGWASGAQFDTAIGCLEILGEINAFKRRREVLLEPAYFHTYASALIAGARADRAGMGRLAPRYGRRVQADQLAISEEDRIADAQEEHRVLEATINDLIEKNVAQEVSTNEGAVLVFPRSLTRVWTGTDNTDARAVLCRYQGAVDDVFSSLIVRLLALGSFYPESELFKNAAFFAARSGGVCGLTLETDNRTPTAELSVIFRGSPEGPTRNSFVEAVRRHIENEAHVVEWLYEDEAIATGATEAREVFFCHRLDKDGAARVAHVAARMRERGIDVWNDEARHAGESGTERDIRLHSCRVAVLFVDGDMSELFEKDWNTLLRRRCEVIPVLMPSTPKQFSLPHALRKYRSVDLREIEIDFYAELAQGIRECQRKARKTTPSTEAGPMMKHVFVSYSRTDRDLVEPIVEALTDHDHPVWWDDTVTGGADWKLAIQEAMNESYAVVVCFTTELIARAQTVVNSEIRFAIERLKMLPPDRTFLIPVCLDACQLPRFPIGGDRYLADLEFIDGFNRSDREIGDAVVAAVSKARDQALGKRSPAVIPAFEQRIDARQPNA